ncbi:MAG: hypothetical protein HQK88_03185 [Nitrospirae bacterium]|nr:hypothetical protein [Nitrospirota bacterium]MBF0521348.1 hypothetical protein [Nitrospirota bacterium]MBF0536262.1 hypothetical protein [Nitrospirota bacterium]MBF0615804.1 hypothetical protein [Nitrospirota bacterium]
MKNVNSVRLFLILLAITVTTLMVGGCAGLEQAHHEYLMKGTILEKTGDEVYLCIGTKDGAQVGQELNVYLTRRVIGKGTHTDWERVFTGKVKITEIVDEHFAKGKVISGTVKENDIAEL